MKKLFSFVQNEIEDYRRLLSSIPALTITFLVLSVVCANLMANKELVNFKYCALDCGFFYSWCIFLCMDLICKRWGAKAAIKVSLLALAINLLVCISFFGLAKTNGMWKEYYATSNLQTNQTLNNTIGSSWYIVLGSALAFCVSAVVNSLLNSAIGKRLPDKGFSSFFKRSAISTMIGQFVDNLIFSTVVSKIFFGWTWTQVFCCSIIGAIFELLFEIAFSRLGYKILTRWEKDGIGSDYAT